MNALPERTLMINLICSTVVFYVGAWIYVLPKVGKTNARTIPNPRGGSFESKCNIPTYEV